MVIDWFARRVVGWSLSATPDADLVIQALKRAYEQRGRPQEVLLHANMAIDAFASGSGATASPRA